jgi:uncharacterized protein (DUF2249 family)
MTTTQHPAATASDANSVVTAVRRHHTALSHGVADRVATLLGAVDALSPAVEDARTELARYCEAELLPHAAAEEDSLYRAGMELPASRLLVIAMTNEHGTLRALVDQVFNARTNAELAAAAGALRSLFEAHLAKENDLLLPALVEAGVNLGAVVSDLHELLGHADATAFPAAESDADAPLDVRDLAPAVRHERIFARFDAMPPGAAFVLVNDHDPKPLRYQLEAEHPDAFSWDYLETGPAVWRVRIGRPAGVGQEESGCGCGSCDCA